MNILSFTRVYEAIEILSLWHCLHVICCPTQSYLISSIDGAIMMHAPLHHVSACSRSRLTVPPTPPPSPPLDLPNSQSLNHLPASLSTRPKPADNPINHDSFCKHHHHRSFHRPFIGIRAMAEVTPRVNAPYLESFKGHTVRVLGKVVQLMGESAVINAGGEVRVLLNRVSFL